MGCGASKPSGSSTAMVPVKGKATEDNKPIDPRVSEIFQMIDKNSDGVLSKAELMIALRQEEKVRSALGIESVSEGEGRDAFEKAFQKMDKDQSASISERELNEYLAGAFDSTDEVQHRINKIPIVSGSKDSIMAKAGEAEFQAQMTWDGFLGVKTYFVASEEQEFMFTHSRWKNKSFADAAAKALGQVLGGSLKEWIAGPPEPTVGPVRYTFNGSATPPEGSNGAVRLTSIPMKPGSEKAVLAYTSEVEPKFKDLDGVISIEMMQVGDEKMFAIATYATMEALASATPTIATVLGGMKEHFAGKPDAMAATVEWIFTPAA